MQPTGWLATIILITPAACQQASRSPVPANQLANDAAPAVASTAATTGAAPSDTTLVASPPAVAAMMDPKTSEAAAEVVQHYGALIESGRWSQSWELWSNRASAKAFDRNWRADSKVHLEIGKPGEMEGAAGSSYVTVPVTFYGKTLNGDSFRKAATATLRRVNDVPGSTYAQRHWHIERIDLASAA